MGLGHKGPGCEQQAYVAGNTQTPPSGPHHCEDPPVLPSVKGSPFTDGRTGGRPPGDGFCPSSGWLVSGQVQGPRMRRQSPQHRPPSGPRAPPLRYQAGFTRSLGSVPGPGSPPCTAQDGAFSRGPSFAAGLPPPQRQSAPGRPGHLGPGRGSGQGSMPDGDGPGGRVAGPWKSSPWGLRPAPSSVAKSLPWAPTAKPCPEAANQDPAASIL